MGGRGDLWMMSSKPGSLFIALMVPGVCLAPMVTACALSGLTRDTSPAVSEFLWTFAVATAALNFLKFLPFRLLDAGRCLQVSSQSSLRGSTGPLMERWLRR